MGGGGGEDSMTSLLTLSFKFHANVMPYQDYIRVSDLASISICCRWLPSLTVLHVKATNAEAITNAITFYVEDKSMEVSWRGI